jgi:hypothetical protein
MSSASPVAFACLAHAPRAQSRHAVGSGVWSLTLAVLAAVAPAFRGVLRGNYAHRPRLLAGLLPEMLIPLAAAALVALDAARTQSAAPGWPRSPGAVAG